MESVLRMTIAASSSLISFRARQPFQLGACQRKIFLEMEGILERVKKKICLFTILAILAELPILPL